VRVTPQTHHSIHTVRHVRQMREQRLTRSDAAMHNYLGSAG
jgi:hypothetical protein